LVDLAEKFCQELATLVAALFPLLIIQGEIICVVATISDEK
jgi:hypothetical protein